MKKILQCLTRKRIIWGITGAVSFIIFMVLFAVSGGLAVKQDSQMMAKRWSKEGGAAQISCFLSQGAGFDENSIMGFEYGLKNALKEASIVPDSANPSARLWAAAYSATGQITLLADRGSATVNAIGVGGDFFLFHPLKMEKGSYFDGNDVNKDYCVVDEETAWQLFGSNDIAGQMITISGIPHIITGVYSREVGRFAEAAGLDKPLVFVSYETLSTYGIANEIGCYEVVMPNPVKNYAFNYVLENIGVQETEVEILDNSGRYSFVSLVQSLAEFGTRSMNGKAIIYPYWENIARGYEDVLILLLVLEVLFIAYPIILIVIAICLAWKHKSWNFSSVYSHLKDKYERFMEKQWEKKKMKKAKKKKEE